MKQDLKTKIDAWKAEYGKLYKTTIEGEEYIWRKLKRKEYVQVMAEKDETDVEKIVYDRQEEIVKIVTLYPEDISKEIEESAGLAITLSDEIINKSGFGAPETEEL